MIEMPAVVGNVVRSVGLSTAMRAAGVVTGLLLTAAVRLLARRGEFHAQGLVLAKLHEPAQ